MPEGWFKYEDESTGRNYYYQPELQQTEWVRVMCCEKKERKKERRRK